MANITNETLLGTFKLPKFFIDDSASDKFESMMDFFISWTIRCAPERFANLNRDLQKNSKKILSKLLFNNELYLEDKRVINVKTKKQFNAIDVLAEVTIQNQDDEVEEYVLIIENKVYSSVRDGQLAKYREIAQHVYDESYKLKYVLIKLDHEYLDNYKEICLSEGYDLHVIDDLTEMLDGKTTGNELFDEFWFNFNYNDIIN